MAYNYVNKNGQNKIQSYALAGQGLLEVVLLPPNPPVSYSCPMSGECPGGLSIPTGGRPEEMVSYLHGKIKVVYQIFRG